MEIIEAAACAPLGGWSDWLIATATAMRDSFALAMPFVICWQPVSSHFVSARFHRRRLAFRPGLFAAAANPPLRGPFRLTIARLVALIVSFAGASASLAKQYRSAGTALRF